MKTTATPTDKRKNALIKRYHGLLRDAKINDEQKLALLENWKVSSSKELTVNQLEDVCKLLQHLINPTEAELEKWREWTRTCIKSYGRSLGANYTNEYAEGIICAAAKIDNFKDISKKRLQGIYNQFKKSKLDAVTTKQLIVDDIRALAGMN